MKHVMTGTGLLFLRVLAGLGMANHGHGKIFGGRMEGFADGIDTMGFPFPTLFAWMAALSEFFGGVLVAIGLVTRGAAFLIFATMSVAVFIRHGPDPLRAKELALAYWTVSLALMLMGAGPYSLDRFLRRG